MNWIEWYAWLFLATCILEAVINIVLLCKDEPRQPKSLTNSDLMIGLVVLLTQVHWVWVIITILRGQV